MADQDTRGRSSTRLSEVFVELADTLVDDFEAVDFLQMLTERCVELLGLDAAGLMLSDQRGELRLMTSSAERARLLEVFELQVQEGPCLDCFVSGQPVINIDLASAHERWPAFSRAAQEIGYGATHALPMRLRGTVIGALNLFTDRAVRLDEQDVAIGQAMADVATIGLLNERNLREQTVLSEQLQSALHSRVLIEQAKGVLAARAGIDVDAAFLLIRSYARRTGRPLTWVATSVMEGTLDERRLRTP